MPRVNEGAVAVFGWGWIGYAAMGADIDAQNIPSELLDDYTRAAEVVTPDARSRQRYPWSITQPGTPDQLAQWERFLRGVELFNTLSGAQRTDWYNASLASGLFYYTYYQSKFLIGYYTAIFGRGKFGLHSIGRSYI